MKPVSKRFMDASLPLAERVEDLISQLTIEEKVGQMMHEAPAVERLGVPAYNWWNEGLHGVARAGGATVFPQAIGMAASFDVPLMHRVATAISDEARAKHHQALRHGNCGQYFGLTYWSPNINIFRDPRWGRGQETYGEDPYLTSRMGVAFVRGLQGDDPKYLKLVATPKHYAVHSGPEPKRHAFDAVASPRDLAETYLPAFKAAVREAKAFSVMGAYNRTNGEPCCGSPTLLQKTLREAWGFDGYVVSDCGAIDDFHTGHKVTRDAPESAALAVKNGCDLNCGCTYSALIEALRRGLIREPEIDASLRRLFTARFRLGMFDPDESVPFAKTPASVVNSAAHRELARQMARESIVLLKNQDNLLPLDASKLRGIGVIGPTAMDMRVLLGNYYGYSSRMITPMEGIVGAVSPGTNVVYYRGCDLAGSRPVDEGRIKWMTREVDVLVAFVGLSPELEGEEGETIDSEVVVGGDRRMIGLPGQQGRLLEVLKASGKPVVLVLTGGSALEIAWGQREIPAILSLWYPGEEGGNAIADVLFGRYNPAGRLPVTVPRSMDQLPDFEDYRMKGRTYRFMEAQPLYRFGYGLSYTTFAYSNLRLSKSEIEPTESVTVSVDVQNSGAKAGDEVVQLYVSDVEAAVPVPRLHLEGFERLALKPGERKTVSFELKPEQLAAYADDGSPFVEPGSFVISVGGGQPTDPTAGTVAVTLRVGV